MRGRQCEGDGRGVSAWLPSELERAGVEELRGSWQTV